MKNRILTLSLREIKYSFKRFLSLAILSFLGVAFFVGLKLTGPSLNKTIDNYYNTNNVYDIKL